MDRRRFLQRSAAGAAAMAIWRAIGDSAEAAGGPSRPNIVYILTDDLGYGDVGCYGARRVRTPHVDRLAREGLRFTQAYCTSATCTPTRYSLLVGRYAWRKRGTGIASPASPLVIDLDDYTVPRLLKDAGYATGCVGKWHLGLGAEKGKQDWNGELRPGPLEVGFDEAFIIPSTGDRVPCVYVENHRVAGLDPSDPITVGGPTDEPTQRSHPDLAKVTGWKGHDGAIINGIPRLGTMSGGMAARWNDEQMADTLVARAEAFIEKHKERPFFLYFPTHDPHVPRVPHPRFRGTSDCGVRGDVIHQIDWCVGRLMEALERRGLAENTLVIFTSDNGPVVDDGYRDGAAEALGDHRPAGPLQGGKYGVHEGGTRVPFIVRWPAKVKPGTSEALVSQVDTLASFASLLGRKLPPGAGPDSLDSLRALLGQDKIGRDHVVQQGFGALALRKGDWKLIPARGGPALYNLAEDVGETKDLAAAHPDKVADLAALLEKVRGAALAPPRPT